MIIRYLFHSGFAIEFEHRLLVFDYFRHGKPLTEGGLDEIYLSRFENVDFFVSHSHDDHFNNIIFSFDRPGITYFISQDTSVSPGVPNLPSIIFLKKGDQYNKNGILVKAFGSTDEGISFYVETEGMHIFHAGDLNCWHWKNEASEEYAQKACKWFLSELEPIKELPLLDAAFFPVDTRMGDGYYEGALEFVKCMQPKLFVPMHFGKDFTAIPPFAKEAEAFCRVWHIAKRGDILEI